MGKAKSFLAGAAAGAAALFLSKKENRDLVAKKAKQLGKKAKDEVNVIKDEVKTIGKKVSDAAKRAVK